MMNLSTGETMNDDKTTHYSFTEFDSTRANATQNKTSIQHTTEDATFLNGAHPLPRVFRGLVVIFGVTGFMMNGIVLKVVLSKKFKLQYFKHFPYKPGHHGHCIKPPTNHRLFLQDWSLGHLLQRSRRISTVHSTQQRHSRLHGPDRLNCESRSDRCRAILQDSAS